MARDTKLRMSIDPKIIEKMAFLQKKMEEKVTDIPYNYKLHRITFSIDDKYDIVFVIFKWEWKISRVIHKENWNWAQDAECWSVESGDDEDNVMITTYGKMAVDINREILDVIDKVEPTIDNYPEATLCKTCGWNGDPTNTEGLLSFIDKHILGKTDCEFELEAVKELRRLVEDD